MDPKEQQAALHRISSPSRSLAALGVAAGATLLAFCPFAPHSAEGAEDGAGECSLKLSTPEEGDGLDAVAAMRPTFRRASLLVQPVMEWTPQSILRGFDDIGHVEAFNGECTLQGQGQFMLPLGELPGGDLDDATAEFAMFTNCEQKKSFAVVTCRHNVFIQFWRPLDRPGQGLSEIFHIKDWECCGDDGNFRSFLSSAAVAKLTKYTENAMLYHSVTPGSEIYAPWSGWLSKGKVIEFQVGTSSKSVHFQMGASKPTAKPTFNPRRVSPPPILKRPGRSVRVTPLAGEGSVGAVSWRADDGQKRCFAMDLATQKPNADPEVQRRVGRTRRASVEDPAVMKEDLGTAGCVAPQCPTESIKDHFRRIDAEDFHNQMEGAVSRLHHMLAQIRPSF